MKWNAITSVVMLLLAIVNTVNADSPARSGYASVNGLLMYYEIDGPANPSQPPLVLLSAPWKRDGFPSGFFESFQNASLEKMLPQPLKDAFVKANPDPKALQKMFDKDVARGLAFKDLNDADVKAIEAPTLVMNGD